MIKNLKSSDELLSFLGATKEISSISMYYDILYDVSVKIHDYRVKNSMTQKELAKTLSVSQAMVAKYESGDYNFTLETLCNIFQKLNVKVGITLEDLSCINPPMLNNISEYPSECNDDDYKLAGGAA